jgi:hypothetical protein
MALLRKGKGVSRAKRTSPESTEAPSSSHGPPLNFLLGCSELSLDNYELARMARGCRSAERILRTLRPSY